MAKTHISELVLRDGHQSVIATRMRTEDMLPICPKLDNIGFWSLEAWGGATFDTCIRYLNEDPWDRLRQLKKHITHTPLQMLLRGQNLVGYKHYPDDVAELFVRKSVENGVDIFRVFDALNDVRNMEFVIEDAGAIITHDPLPAVTADAIQLTQVFQSLIDNAIKFHGAEPPRLHVSVRETFEISETSKVWEFAIRDNGIGIDPKYQDRIFGVFQRLHTRDKYSGNGIGLAICKKVIERHGGRIWCESRLAQGATFYFTIPTRE